jgi:hypothetical protein
MISVTAFSKISNRIEHTTIKCAIRFSGKPWSKTGVHYIWANLIVFELVNIV